MLHWGHGCVRQEDRPLISCFLSLGKGGAQRCCPCFLMSALETTKTNPYLLHQWYTAVFLPIVHLIYLKLLVPKGSISTNPPSHFFLPFRYNILLLAAWHISFKKQQTLLPWDIAGDLSKNKIKITARVLETITPYNAPLLLQCAQQNINRQLLKLPERRF